LTDTHSTIDSFFHANINYSGNQYTVTSNARYGADYIQVDGLDSREDVSFTISPKDIGDPDPHAYLYIGGDNSITAPNTLVDWHTIEMNALSVQINNAEVATQTWVTSNTLNQTAGDNRYLQLSGGSMTGNITFGQGDKIVFPDNTSVPDSPTNEQVDYITFGSQGSISQVSGRGALMITSSDDSLILANGDVGRSFTNANITVGGESIYMLSDGAIEMYSDLQDGWDGSPTPFYRLRYIGGNLTTYDGTNTYTYWNSNDDADFNSLKIGGTTVIDSSRNIYVPDSQELRLGTGNDLRLFHSSTNSYVDNYTGSLLIRNFANDQDIILATDDGTGGNAAYVICDGSVGDVKLYYADAGSSSLKFQTTATGVEVTGNIEAIVGSNGVIRAVHDGNNIAQLQANTSGGVLGLNAQGTNNVLLRSYGDSFFVNNVAIGKTSASEKLDVSGNAAISGNLKVDGVIYHDTDTSDAISSGTWYRIIEITGGSGRGKCDFTLDSGGGSGTPFTLKATVNTNWANSGSTLVCHFNSYGSGVRDLRVVRNSTSNKSFVDVRFSGGEDNVVVRIQPTVNAAAATIDFTNVTTLPTGDSVESTLDVNGKVFSTTSSQASGNFVVTYDSQVGIKNPSPNYDLDVLGNARIDDDTAYGGLLITGRNAPALTLLDESHGTSENLIYAQSTADVQGVLRLSADDNNVGTDSSMEFRVDGSEAMRIDTGGNVGINTTLPRQKLSVVGTINSDSQNDYYGAWLTGDSSSSGQSHLGLGAWWSTAAYVRYYNNDRLSIYTYDTNEDVTLQEAGGSVAVGASTTIGKFRVNVEDDKSRIVISRGGTNLSTNTSIGALEYYADYNGSPIQYATIEGYANGLSGVRGSLDFNVKSTSGNILNGMTIYGTSSGVNVGIGTSSPSHKLTVSGDTYLNGKVGIGITPTTTWDLRIRGQYPLALSNSSSVAKFEFYADLNENRYLNGAKIVGYNQDLLIDTTSSSYDILLANNGGKVGIGTTTPSTKLHVAGSAVINGTYRGGALQVNDYNYNADGIRVYGYSNNEILSLISRYDQADGGLFFKRGNNGAEATIGEINWVSNQFRVNATVGSLAIQTGNSTAITVDSSQNVGIGTSPDYKLDVAGNLRTTSSILAQSSSYIDIECDQTDSAAVKIGVSSGSTEGFLMVDNTGTNHITSVKPIIKFLGNDGTIRQYGRLTVDNSNFTAFDLTGARTSPLHAFSITAENNNNPYTGFGGSLTFRNRIYNGGASPGSIRDSARIRSSINTNFSTNGGTDLIFETNATGDGVLNPVMYVTQYQTVAIGQSTTSGGDYTATKPKLHVRGSDSSGSYHTVARFQAGNDSDNTGAAVIINHSNDRGLVIKAGRKDSDREVAYFDVLSSGGNATNMLTMGKYASDHFVGIKTATPEADLDVNGAIVSRGGTYDAGTDTNSNIGLVIQENDYIYTEDSGTYLRKLIGKASDIIQIGQSGTSLIDGVYFYSGTACNYRWHNNGSVQMQLNATGLGILDSTPSYALDVNGTIRATGDVIAYSDARVKENVKTIDNALDKVTQLRGVSYNKIGETDEKIGVIAQEIEKVLPQVVAEDDNGMKSVAYGNIVGVLIEAIKEQQKQIDELKARLDGSTR